MQWQYKRATEKDLHQLKLLAIKSCSRFANELTPHNWALLKKSLNNDETYSTLLNQSICINCCTKDAEIIGMAFLVLSGHPTNIYKDNWSYIRFLTVDPNYAAHGIGTGLAKQCIALAKAQNEHTIALHTSELMAAARYIYEKLGFKILREIEPRLGKRYWLYVLNIAD